MSNETLKVSVLADVSDLKKGMSQVQSELNNTKGKVGSFSDSFKGIAKAAVAAFSVKAVVDFGKQAINATADLRALDAQFDQTFSGDAAEAMKRINSQSAEMNINVDRLKGGYSSFQGMFKGFGIEASSAMELTDTSMRLAADAAAYYDKSLEDTSASLKSFMMGNLTAGDAIGVNYTGTMRDIDAKKKYGKAWKDLTQEQQSFLMADVVSTIYEQSGAMGQAARESDSWENTTANLKATWDRLLEVLGSPILDGLTVVLSKVGEGVEWLTAALKGVDFSSIFGGSTALGDLKNSAGGVVAYFQESWPLIKEKALEVFAYFQEIYNSTLLPAFEAIKSAVMVVKDIFLAVMPVVKEAFRIAFDAMKQTWENVLKPVFDLIVEIVQAVADKFQEHMPAIQAFFGDMAAAIKSAYEEFIKPAFDKVGEVIAYAIEKFKELADSVSTFIEETVVPVLTDFINMLKELYEENKDKLDKIKELFNAAGDAIKNIIDVVVTFIQDKVLPFLAVIYGAIQENMDSIKAVFQNAFDTVMSILDVFIALFKGDWKGAWNAVKQTVSNLFETIKSVIKAALNIVNDVLLSFGIDVKQIWTDIKTKITDTVNNIKTSISDKFNAVKTTVTTIFNNIKRAITSPIEKARDTVKSVIDKIKGFFNFEWSLPKLKMPSFSVSGKFGLNPLSVPKLGIDWKARGGIFTKPTVLNGIGVGDASNGHGSAAEVVAPLSDLKQMLGLSEKERNVTINLNGNYSFRDREDMDYFNNQLALAARRV